MQADPESNKLSPSRNWSQWADRLACPACHGTLRSEAETIVCTACARSYPILNGIPVLISDRASNGQS
jgi:uncharacterized protein